MVRTGKNQSETSFFENNLFLTRFCQFWAHFAHFARMYIYIYHNKNLSSWNKDQQCHLDEHCYCQSPKLATLRWIIATTRTQARKVLYMSEIIIYRALCLPFYCSSLSFIPTVNQSRFNPVFSTVCAYYCLFLVWCSSVKTPLLVSSSPWETLWISPELHYTSPTWPLAVEIQTVSNFHFYLSPLWFLHWK